MIDIDNYPNFKILIWDNPEESKFDEEYFYSVLENRFYCLEPEQLTDDERELIRSLAERFSNGIFAGYR